jgi:SAM-dependent methyltransferase
MNTGTPLGSRPAFRSVYEAPGVYDEVLLRHFFAGREDTDLVSDWLTDTFGPTPPDRGGASSTGLPSAGARGLRVVEFGCGTGRVTARTAPYAATLLGSDYSSVMTQAFAERFPGAETLCADTRDAVATLLGGGRQGGFDLVSAFWSLSYPLGACFETLDADGIRPVADLQQGRQMAKALVAGLVDLLAPGGHLLAMLFDADSPEQRLVTWAWEKVVPTPFDDRTYTRTVLLEELLAAENAGRGSLTWTRRPGVAVAPDRTSALRWFTAAHFKDLPRLTRDREVMDAVTAFIDRWTGADGIVTLPAGVHLIDFHRDAISATHLPTRDDTNPPTGHEPTGDER